MLLYVPTKSKVNDINLDLSLNTLSLTNSPHHFQTLPCLCLRLTQLLLPKELEEPRSNSNLKTQPNPEPRLANSRHDTK